MAQLVRPRASRGAAHSTTSHERHRPCHRRANTNGLLIYGATITAFGANSYYTSAHEAIRQRVNTYIKSGVFDDYLDFDAAVTDGGNPPKLLATYDTWAQTDGLHLNPAGYQKLADSIDMSLFTK